jgi:hypothetical protein
LANKKGDKYQCEDCGLVLLVDEPCGCEPCEIVCCGTPMKPVSGSQKAKPKTSTAKPSPKPKK